MKARIIALLVSMFLFQDTCICQSNSDDCNEKPGSSKKLFVFVGELLHANTVPARLNYNETRFVATYRILERICGYYPAVDTISLGVIQVSYDSGFKKNKYQLLMLTKDTAEGEDYVLWANLYFDVLKKTDGQWAVSYNAKNKPLYQNQPELKPKKIRISKNSWFDTNGMTREAIDINYPEPYYKIKKNKAIPLFGNSIAEMFQHQKNETFGDGDIYDRPISPADSRRSDIVIQDVELEEIPELDEDSFRLENEKAYLAIKQELSKNPFDEKAIEKLVRNCRSSDNYDPCSAFFDDLIRDNRDSVKAYLLKAKFMHPRATFEDSTLIGLLKQVLKIDSLNYEANYGLGLSYYKFFREQPTGYFARSARKYFASCINIDMAQLEQFRYPLIQLSNYLKDRNSVSYYSGLKERHDFGTHELNFVNNKMEYIPIGLFLADTTKWVHDFTLDLIHKLRYIKQRIDGFSSTLSFFREPILTVASASQVYRFSWFRAFHEPVVIRIEKTSRQVTLHWKMLTYDDSLKTYLPAIEMKKKIRQKQWNKFEKSLRTIDYWHMVPDDPSAAGADGASWVLEGYVNQHYHYTERWSYNYAKYNKCLEYLIELTDLDIPEDLIY